MKFSITMLFIFSITLSFAQLNNPDNWMFFQSPQKVNDILEDGDDLWFATEKGLVIMNKHTKQQTYYNNYNSVLPSEDVKAITQIGDSKFIGTYDLNLLQVNPAGEFIPIEIPIDSSQLLVNEMALLYCLKADLDGNLWIGTNFGVIKYDGNDFEIINFNNTPETGNTFRDVWAIDVDENNNIYFSSFELYKYHDGTYTNLCNGISELFAYGDPHMKYADGKVWYSNFAINLAWYDAEGWHYVDEEQLPGSLLSGIDVDKNGKPHFYFQHAGIYTFEDGLLTPSPTSLATDTDLLVDKIIFDEDNNLWVSDKAAFHTIENETVVSGILGDTPMRNNNISQITEDNNGKIYMINDYKNLLTYDYEQGWGELQLPEFSTNPSISAVAFDQQNHLWASTNVGLLHFDGNYWTQYSEEVDNEVPFSSCYRLLIDQNDIKWMTIPGGAIAKLDGENWTVFDYYDIPFTDYIVAMELDANNDLWIADKEGHLFKINQDNSYEQIETSNILFQEYSKIRTIHCDKNGKIWVITNYNDARQVFYLENNEWVELDDDPELHFTGGIVENEAGLHFETNNAIAILKEDGTFEFISKENSLLRHTYLGAMFIDSRNSLWVKSEGINVYNAEGFLTTAFNNIEEESTVEWQAFPNPAINTVTVKAVHSSFSNDNPVSINLLDASGKVIYSINERPDLDGTLNTQLNVNKLPTGIYFINIKGLPAKAIVVK